MNVKVFLTTYWAITMASGALSSRSCYPPLSSTKLPGQIIFPIIYWWQPLLEWRFFIRSQVSYGEFFILFLFPLLLDHISEVEDWRIQGWNSVWISQSSGATGTLRVMSCSLLYFPYGKFTASAEHPVGFREPSCCPAPKIGYKIGSIQCIFLYLQVPPHCIAQPPIWKSCIHLQITVTQFRFNESRTQLP